MPETNITYLIIPELKKFIRQQIKKKKKDVASFPI